MYVYGAGPPIAVTVIDPSHNAGEVWFVVAKVPVNPKHGFDVIVNVCVTGVPFTVNVTLYVPGQRFVTI